MVKLSSLARNISTVWLLCGSYVAVLAVILLLFGTGVYLQFDRYVRISSEVNLWTNLVRDWYSATDEDPRTLRRYGQLTAPPDFPSGARELARRLGGPGLYVRILTPDGQVLAEWGRSSHAPPIEYDRLPALIRLPSFYTVSRDHRDWQVLLAPILRDRQKVGVVQLCSYARATRDLTRTLSGYLVVGGCVALALTAVLGVLMARFLVFPVQRLLKATRRVSAGDLTARTELAQGSNEIYALSGEFDRMVDRLQDSFEAQRRFVADASHELKTPLTAISGMSEMLKVLEVGPDDPRRRRALDTIETEVERMDRLVLDLITLSKSDVSPARDPVPVDLAAVVGEAVGAARAIYGEGRIRVEPLPRAWVRGDYDALVRVVRNLLDNAVAYSPPDSEVQVDLAKQGSEWRLGVRDQGVGIAPEDLPHVFERFYRADRSRTRRTGGSGLGLAIVKAMVEQHAGRVTVDSQPGRGSLFQVRLPAIQSPGGA